MSWNALRKRVGGFFSRLRQQSPPSSPPGEPCAATTGASEPHEKVRGRLHRAAASGNLAWLRRWRGYWKRVGIDGRDQQRRTPLHLASANGHADVVRYLAGKNCQLNLADNFRRTPLMEAVRCQQEECVAVLLEHGADPNLADADGNTALHLAVLSANTAVAGLLLEHNASSDARNQEGYTPLNLAISKQHKEMLECLLNKAADRHAAEQCERTPLAVTTSHASDVEEDNLCLQEKLETLEAELREVQEKYLQSEHILRGLKSALDDKDREETAAVLKLQDQLLAYLETNTAVKRLQEEAHRLEIQNTRWEGTVQQQSTRIEALQRELQASASASVPQLQQKLASADEVQSTSKASLAATTRHEADVEKGNLCLQEELARVQGELREVQEKYLQSERCVRTLKSALDDKDREQTAAAQKLQDLLLASLETQTIAEQLEEHVQRLVVEKTSLEGTVRQQSTRIEALQRELQASASASVPQLQQKLAREAEVQSTSRASVAVTTRQWADLEKDRLYLHKELAWARAEVIELSQQLTTESKRSMQLEAKNKDLQEELSTLHGNCEKLEKSKCQLKEEVAKLQHQLEINMVDRSHMEQYKREVEERAGQEIRQKLHEVNLFLQAQAASQDRLEQIKASHHASLRNQLKDRIRDLECELDKIKNTQQETAFPKECVQAEMEKYKELYLEEVKTRRCLAKKLESLVVEKTSLEGTVRQQSTRIEALQRELQASASASVPQLQQKLAREAEVQSTSRASVAVTTRQWADLEKDRLYLHKELAWARAEVIELSQQLTTESKRSMQLEAKNRDLQEELSTLHGNCEKLEKSKCQLKEEVAKLQHQLEINMVDRSHMEQYKREVEERAGQEIRQKLYEVNLFLQAQAASQDRLEQIRASHHASLRNQLKDRIRDLECELDKIKNTQQETAFPKECVQVEMEKYKELYLEEVKTRRCLAKKLERANERLEEANAKLLREPHKSKSLITSSTVGGGPASTPVPCSTALGHLGNNSGLDRSRSEGGSFLSQCEKMLSSRKRLVAFVAKGQQELDEKITKELKEATAELETPDC